MGCELRENRAMLCIISLAHGSKVWQLGHVCTDLLETRHVQGYAGYIPASARIRESAGGRMQRWSTDRIRVGVVPRQSPPTPSDDTTSRTVRRTVPLLTMRVSIGALERRQLFCLAPACRNELSLLQTRL